MSIIKKRNLLPYLLLAPTLILLGVVVFYPIMIALRFSLYKASLFAVTEKTFVGFKNFQWMLSQRDFWHTIMRTVLFSGSSVMGSYFLGLATALLLNIPFKGRIVSKSLFIIPWAVPVVVACLAWKWIFNESFGILSFIMQKIGLISTPVHWLSDPSVALFSVVMVQVWKYYPIVMVSLFGAFQSIPTQLYEAGKIDGAGRVQLFWHITLPGIKYVSLILTLLLLMWGLSSFAIIWLMTGGGPAQATETLSIHVYLQAFRFFDVGYASALSVVILMLSMCVAVIYIGLLYRPRI